MSSSGCVRGSKSIQTRNSGSSSVPLGSEEHITSLLLAPLKTFWQHQKPSHIFFYRGRRSSPRAILCQNLAAWGRSAIGEMCISQAKNHSVRRIPNEGVLQKHHSKCVWRRSYLLPPCVSVSLSRPSHGTSPSSWHRCTGKLAIAFVLSLNSLAHPTCVAVTISQLANKVPVIRPHETIGFLNIDSHRCTCVYCCKSSGR